MLRPFALIGTVGMVAMWAGVANAQQVSDCQACDQSGGIYYAGSWAGDGNCRSAGCNLAAPTKGWNAPLRLPVNRDGIWYRNNWPQAWYGNPGGGFIGNSPMVYQPTDTTQLGFSYAKVPTWQARRMIPPTPCPSDFHVRGNVPVQSSRLPDPCLGRGCRTCETCPQGHSVTKNRKKGLFRIASFAKIFE
ncbi:MAG: hypothetical protein MK110_08330 [Fuerstiella sp.]|nr:hypothetical protein [Fuerstiella sp.]